MEEMEIAAAYLLLKQHSEDPDFVAAQRADAAYDQGGMLNFRPAPRKESMTAN
jgi:hypothetical protein